MNVLQVQLEKSSASFKDYENRTNFFEIARNLYSKGLKTEAQLLLLTTWNFALFRYVTKSFDIGDLVRSMEKLNPHFNRLKNERIETIDLNRFEPEISIIYSELSNIPGVKFTGAPKLMHLENPNLFIMWDTYIRGQKAKKYYNRLKINKLGIYAYKKYGTSSSDYIQFLMDMKTKFQNIKFNHKTKSLAKAIDEFNYLNITYEIQAIEKETKNNG